MRNHIVGAFTPDQWTAHGKQWLASAQTHKGNANVLVLQSTPYECDVKTKAYDGTIPGIFKTISQQEGVFLFAAPHVRFQAEPVLAFEKAQSSFAVVERKSSTQVWPFAGKFPVYEEYWAAPYDLIDMLHRVIEVSRLISCRPKDFETNYVSYFAEAFRWFRDVLPATEFLPVYDANQQSDHYADQNLVKLTAVGLDRPETKKAGVIGGIVKKSLLTSAVKE